MAPDINVTANIEMDASDGTVTIESRLLGMSPYILIQFPTLSADEIGVDLHMAGMTSEITPDEAAGLMRLASNVLAQTAPGLAPAAENAQASGTGESVTHIEPDRTTTPLTDEEY